MEVSKICSFLRTVVRFARYHLFSEGKLDGRLSDEDFDESNLIRSCSHFNVTDLSHKHSLKLALIPKICQKLKWLTKKLTIT